MYDAIDLFENDNMLFRMGRDDEVNKDSEREMLRTGASGRFPQMPRQDSVFPHQYCINIGLLKAHTVVLERRFMYFSMHACTHTFLKHSTSPQSTPLCRPPAILRPQFCGAPQGRLTYII